MIKYIPDTMLEYDKIYPRYHIYCQKYMYLNAHTPTRFHLVQYKQPTFLGNLSPILGFPLNKTGCSGGFFSICDYRLFTLLKCHLYFANQN